MKALRVFCAVVCLLGLTQLVWSQREAPTVSKHGIPGFLDPQTRTFRTQVENSNGSPNATTGTYYYGTINVTLTVYTASAFPAGTTYVCEVNTTVFDYPLTQGNNAWVIAPAPSKGYTTCTTPINYFWQLSTPQTDRVYIDYYVTAYSNFGQTNERELAYAYRTTESFLGVPTVDGTVTSLAWSTRF
jgi:hypothetical protein